MQMTTKLIFNRSDKLDSQGKGLISCRVTYNRKKRLINNGIRILPKFWNEKKEEIRSSHPNVVALRNDLRDMLDRLDQCFRKLHRSRNDFTIDDIMNLYNGGSLDEDVFAFLWKVHGRRNVAFTTLKQEKLAINYLNSYKPDLTWDDLNYDFLVGFEQFLLEQPNYRDKNACLSRNYVTSILRMVRIYMKEAIKSQILKVNPFTAFKLRTEVKEVEFLTLKQIRQFADADVSNRRGYVQECQDMFLFACYTSIRFSDLCTMTMEHIVTRGDDTYLVKQPVKTKGRSDKKIDIPINKIFYGWPLDILLKYLVGKRPGQRIFSNHNHYTFNKTYNENIRIVAKVAGLDVHLTSHIARHSTAMLLMNEFDFSIEEVKTLLAHSDIATTQKYARTTYDKLHREIQSKFSKS